MATSGTPTRNPGPLTIRPAGEEPGPEQGPVGGTGIGPGIGQPPENRRQMVVKLAWMLLWMLYLAYPISDLTSGQHSWPAQLWGWSALVLFLGAYIALVLVRGMLAREWKALSVAAVVLMPALAVATTATLGGSWVTLFVYAGVTVGAVLPPRYAIRGVLAMTVLTVLVGLAAGVADGPDAPAFYPLVFSTLLGGFAMTGLQRLVRTMGELREARRTVAELAVADERLRMARDLHDLLGHSLSLITLKAELTGRLMDQQRDEDARAQVADIEQVGRQALVDVRAAVGGYRRPKLSVELVAARTAFAAAKVELDAGSGLPDRLPRGLGVEEEAALGWALRESVTNIVRHSGAGRCAVRLRGDGSSVVTLEITDDGCGPGRSAPGNGLTGLAERLAAVGGELSTGAAPGGGFRLCATVPVREGR
jgi:two-component system sensor histidine kinase DesK